MVQVINKGGSLLGRLGKAYGQALSDTIPKEIERNRLASGLKALGEQKDLSPFQQFTGLVSQPGMTPQIIQSGSEILRQEGITNAMLNRANQQPQQLQNPYQTPQQQTQNQQASKTPSVTTTQPIKATVENYIPKDFNQLQNRAGELIQTNPQLYANNPSKAMDDAVREDAQNQSINQAYQQRRLNQQDVQSDVTSGLKEQSESLGVDIPPDVYSNIEDNAIEDLNQGNKTPEQIKKERGKELDKISRQYKNLDTLGGWTLLTKNPNENLRSLKTLRNEFKERNDLENFALRAIKTQNLSPESGFYLAYPNSDIKSLNNELARLPRLEQTPVERVHGIRDRDMITKKTLDAAPKLAQAMGKEGSPLAIKKELDAKDYDGKAWLDYVTKHRKELGLTERQGRELEIPLNNFPTLDDIWLFMFNGLDKLVEQ